MLLVLVLYQGFLVSNQVEGRYFFILFWILVEHLSLARMHNRKMNIIAESNESDEVHVEPPFGICSVVSQLL